MTSVIDGWTRGRGLPKSLAGGAIIPTWQVDQEQHPPHDLERFAREGYSKNSLIYSCVREKATSFAGLTPIIVRRDESVIRNHRLLDLLEDPNPDQDGAEFREELKTHLDAAGNAYIEKVRSSADPARRREWASYPMQELSLIRPDYVTIEPGARGRVSDTYLVTIGGQVRKRIPRRDLIHLQDVNLTNDFYGLSKIALLVREGSIDLKMSDFELAFFTNAGVPLGLMLVKGRVNQADVDEGKRKFDRLFNGLDRWFRSLWLRAEDAEYKQLALGPKDMEQEATRFHVESRICTVFGVHPAIVHARVANEMPRQPYEEIEHAFWSETMVPEAKRIASGLTKQLLPEFATTRDRRARVAFDFTEVRALQEDRSRKLREVVRMVITGGFTVNQALLLVGMNPIDGADFYVRNGNQVIVRVGSDGSEELVPMSGAPASEGGADNPLEGAARLMDREDEEEELFKRLSIFLSDQRR